MTRALALFALAVLLVACGAPAPATPARVELARAQTSTAVWRVVGSIGEWNVDLSIYQETGTPPTPVQTPSPTQTAPVTNTPRATEVATATKQATGTPVPTNTPTHTFTPAESPTAPPTSTPGTSTPAPTIVIENGCMIGIATSALNLRTGPGATYGAIGQLHTPGRYEVVEVQFVDMTPTRSDEWARVKVGPLTGWIAAYYNGGTLAIFDLSEECNDLRFPPPKVGLHLIFSAQSGPVLALIDRRAIGSLKGTDGTEWLIIEAERRYKGLISIWRNLATGLGWRDNPALWGIGDPRVTADQWFDAQYGTWQTRGLLGVVDYFEYRNEALFIGAWEVAFDLRILERANAAGVCVAVWSDGYGNPTISEFVQRKPVLDYILAHPCAPGRYHAIASHIYEGVNGGLWKFLRWRLFLGALGDERYYAIPWIFTEYSDKLGTGPADCGAVIADARAAAEQFAKYPEVQAFEVYSVGSGTQWVDVTLCLPGL